MASDSSERAGGSNLTSTPPSPARRVGRGTARVFGSALLVILGVLSPLMGLMMAMFSEGLDEPWRSTPMTVAYIGVGVGVICFIAAVGVARGRRWGAILGFGAVAFVIVAGSRL